MVQDCVLGAFPTTFTSRHTCMSRGGWSGTLSRLRAAKRRGWRWLQCRPCWASARVEDKTFSKHPGPSCIQNPSTKFLPSQRRNLERFGVAALTGDVPKQAPTS